MSVGTIYPYYTATFIICTVICNHLPFPCLILYRAFRGWFVAHPTASRRP
jgi:hypothetical protein